jgi:hypothetical protein
MTYPTGERFVFTGFCGSGERLHIFGINAHRQNLALSVALWQFWPPIFLAFGIGLLLPEIACD